MGMKVRCGWFSQARGRMGRIGRQSCRLHPR